MIGRAGATVAGWPHLQISGRDLLVPSGHSMGDLESGQDSGTSALIGFGAGCRGKRDQVLERMREDLGADLGEALPTSVADGGLQVAADPMQDVQDRSLVRDLDLLSLGRYLEGGLGRLQALVVVLVERL